jgi:hypothetical protein
MLGVDLVELVPDQAMIVEVESTGERDLRTYRQWIGRRGRCSAELALSIGDHASGRNFTAGRCDSILALAAPLLEKIQITKVIKIKALLQREPVTEHRKLGVRFLRETRHGTWS